jgi:hypothetical protein
MKVVVSEVVRAAVVGDELIVGGYLGIVCRLELPVEHVVFLHAHEGGVRIGLRVTVASLQEFLLLPVAFQLFSQALPMRFTFLSQSTSRSASSILSTIRDTLEALTCSAAGVFLHAVPVWSPIRHNPTTR